MATLMLISMLTGAALPTGDFPLDTAVVCSSQGNPKLAFSGTSYLAVFEDRRNGQTNVYDMRLSPSGVRLDPVSIPIATSPNSQTTPAIAAGDTYYLVAWSESLSIRARRVKFTGEIEDSVSINLGPGTNPDVAFDGTNYFVAWQCTNNAIRAAHISQGGQLLSPGVIQMPDQNYNNYETSVACGDSCSLVVWEQWWFEDPNFYSEILGCRLNSECILLDSTPRCICDGGTTPCVGYDGDKFLVAWNGVSYRSVSRDGVMGEGRTMPYGYGFSPAESFDGTSSYIVWSEEWTEDRNDQNYNIYGARLDTDAVVDSFTVSQQPDTQAFPSIACCGVGRSLVVYQMYTDSINGHPVGEVRVWGVLYPSVGLPEGNPRSDISRLLTVSPNPFRGQAKFAWSLPQSGKTSLKVYDYTGRLVRRVFQGECHSGQGSAVWNGEDGRGRLLPAGVYFVRLDTPGASITRSVTILR